MSEQHPQYVNDLEKIIRALADTWPADRDNIAVAGIAFEEFISKFGESTGQLQKMIDLAWEGLKHLYEQDDYFMTVKAATMQAVNSIREYLLREGEIPVEDFEKACNDLEKALSGEGESADSVIELDEEPAASESGSDRTTLDDLAALIMTIDDGHAVTDEELKRVAGMLKGLTETQTEPDRGFLKDALDIVEKQIRSGDRSEEWLQIVSEKTEQAIAAAGGDMWEEPETGSSVPEKKEQNGEFHIPEEFEETMAGEYVTECSDLLDTAESALLDLEEQPENAELINTVFRAFHTIKGTSAFMGLDPISEFTHSLETLLSMVREEHLSFDRACADISLEAIDIIKQMLTVVESASGGDPLPLPKGYDGLMNVLFEICENGKEPAKAMAKEPSPPATSGVSDAGGQTPESAGKAGRNGTAVSSADPAGDGLSAKPESESTVRVNVSRLDRLIDMVGELVIAHSVVAQDEAIARNAELQKKVNHTTKILRELQDTSLILRMVPLKATFHKMNRLVRDLTRKAGKSVKFSTVGEDTEIDRNMVDVMNEPLVHMLRNAIDHGIEDPQTRARTGKPETANVWLRAYQEGGKVVIEIEDDGKGIDKEKVLDKAIRKGLVDPEQKLTDSEIFNLIFLPGFSSKDEVTDLSGRGVGMDVVKRSIEQLQGKIEVKSQKGEGTKISLELPFTLAITDGMLVQVGEQRFIIPTINIDMTFRAEEEDLFTVMGNTEQVRFRDQSVPVIRLHRLFSIPDAKENPREGTLLVIKNNQKRYALLVDEVIGQQQLVGKSININLKMPHISGGAILGDGKVGLILDTTAVVQ